MCVFNGDHPGSDGLLDSEIGAGAGRVDERKETSHERAERFRIIHGRPPENDHPYDHRLRDIADGVVGIHVLEQPAYSQFAESRELAFTGSRRNGDARFLAGDWNFHHWKFLCRMAGAAGWLSEGDRAYVTRLFDFIYRVVLQAARAHRFDGLYLVHWIFLRDVRTVHDVFAAALPYSAAHDGRRLLLQHRAHRCGFRH